jgi:hypothetical protein
MNDSETPPALPIPPEQLEDHTVRERIADVADKLKRTAAIALIALGGAGCAVDHSSVNDPPTQHDVAEVSIKDIAIGSEGDANGIVNSRDAVDVPRNIYTKDGSIKDAIGGLPNFVMGIKDPEAGNAPRSDGNVLKKVTETTPGETTYEIVPGGTQEVKKPNTVEITTEKVVSGEDIGNTQYERDFETDVATFEQALTPAERVAQETLALIKDGYTVTSVGVMGRASGEDHTTNTILANLGEPSSNNVQLAEQRGMRGKAALDAEMQAQGIELSGIPITIGGVEVEPTQDQMSQLTAAADSLGISVSELTERFNTHVGGLNPEQTQLLVETLANNRGVSYEVRASKTDRVEDGTFVTTLVELPPEVRATLQPSIEKNSWLFRVEIPGEALLVLAAIGLGLAGSRLIGGGGIGIPRIPVPPGGLGPRPIPRPTPGGPPTGISINSPPPTTGIPEKEPPKKTPPPTPRPRQEILTKGPGREDTTARGTSRKQPRPHNMSGNRGRNSPQNRGGGGRMSRSRGGNRRGKRG